MELDGIKMVVRKGARLIYARKLGNPCESLSGIDAPIKEKLITDLASAGTKLFLLRRWRAKVTL